MTRYRLVQIPFQCILACARVSPLQCFAGGTLSSSLKLRGSPALQTSGQLSLLCLIRAAKEGGKATPFLLKEQVHFRIGAIGSVVCG